jgi:hypothetical protein
MSLTTTQEKIVFRREVIRNMCEVIVDHPKLFMKMLNLTISAKEHSTQEIYNTLFDKLTKKMSEYYGASHSEYYDTPPTQEPNDDPEYCKFY